MIDFKSLLIRCIQSLKEANDSMIIDDDSRVEDLQQARNINAQVDEMVAEIKANVNDWDIEKLKAKCKEVTNKTDEVSLLLDKYINPCQIKLPTIDLNQSVGAIERIHSQIRSRNQRTSRKTDAEADHSE